MYTKIKRNNIKMGNVIKLITCTLSLLFIIWVIISWVNVLCTKLDPLKDCWNWNFFKILTEVPLPWL